MSDPTSFIIPLRMSIKFVGEAPLSSGPDEGDGDSTSIAVPASIVFAPVERLSLPVHVSGVARA